MIQEPEKMRTDWPFPIGESPFQIKGQAYVGTLAGARELAGSKARWNEFEVSLERQNPKLAAFLKQRFLIGTLYDVYPLAVHSVYFSAFLGMPYRDYAILGSRMQVQKDLSGIYRFVLQLVSPETIVKRMVANTANYTPFYELTIEELDKHHATIKCPEHPKLLAPWNMPAIEGYASEALERAGAKSPKVTVEAENLSRRIHGTEAVALRLTFRWE